MTILDLLASAAHGNVRLRFLPEHPEPVSAGRLWEDAGRAASWLAARNPPGGAVAAILQASPSCVSALVGAWYAGLTLVSLPLRARSQDSQRYGAMIRQLVQESGAAQLLLDPGAVGSFPDPGVPVVTFPDCLTGKTLGSERAEGRFIQFSSGTTARPKGIVLSMSALGANLAALLSVVAHEDPVVCSWLPLSHDMGLVGSLLGGWAMGGSRYSGCAEIVLMRPELFLLRPARWLQACSELGATATAAPTFALRTAARRRPSPGTDLSTLRIIVVGAETVDAASLRLFLSATRQSSLDPLAICPAYGLAEVGVAATLVPPSQHWRSVTVDSAALADGRWTLSPDGTELVALGAPLPGTEIRIAAGPGGLGEIMVRSSSQLDSYLGGEPGGTPDGWLPTGDIGYLDKDLYVLGRYDDVINVRGAKLHAAPMEAALREALPGDSRSPTIVQWLGGYAVVIERGLTGVADDANLGQAVRAVLTAQVGVAPGRVVVVPSGTLPRTPSGKIRRSAVGQRLFADRLFVIEQWKFEVAGESDEDN